MSDNKKLFQDFDRTKAFNWILAIEPEISKNFMFDVQWEFFDNQQYTSEKLNNSTQSANDKIARKDCFKWLKFHMESSMICEIDNTHTFPVEKRLELIDTIQEWFKDSFSVWWSWYPSWWVHFHIFTHKGNEDIFQAIAYKDIHNNLEALPLRAMIKWNKLYSRNRWVNNHRQHENNNDQYLRRDQRSNNAVYKNDFLPGIEFRWNNVFDIRLYWYYVAITILSLAKWKLPLIFSRDDSNKLAKGQGKQYHNRGWTQTQSYDKFWRLSLDILSPDLIMNDSQLEIFKKNLGKIYFILSFNKLTEARRVLEEYINERMWIEVDAIPFDFITWVELPSVTSKELEWYKIQKDWIDIFTSTRLSIRKLITKLWLTPNKLSRDILELAMDSISLVKLIPLTNKQKLKNTSSNQQTEWTDWTSSIL